MTKLQKDMERLLTVSTQLSNSTYLLDNITQEGIDKESKAERDEMWFLENCYQTVDMARAWLSMALESKNERNLLEGEKEKEDGK